MKAQIKWRGNGQRKRTKKGMKKVWKGEGKVKGIEKERGGREKGKVRIRWDRKRNGMKSFPFPFAHLISCKAPLFFCLDLKKN